MESTQRYKYVLFASWKGFDNPFYHIAIPVIYKKAGDDYNKGISNIYNGQDYTNELNSIGRRTKGIIITGVVCGLGELAGIFCIARYRTHRDEYDPPFYFTPTLYEESIGFSFMKTF